MKFKLKPLTRLIVITGILGVALVVIFHAKKDGVFAQTTDEGWADPINLSQSGGVTNPYFVVDSEGITHVIWVDNFSLVYNFARDDEFPGFVYTRNEAGEWAQPEAVRFPFDSYQPRLIADDNGQIHAFWIDEDSVLLYSHVPGSLITNSSGWTTTQQLARSAIDLDVNVDEDGNIHLVYVRTQETSELPAGVYYRGSSDGGNIWSDGQSLYLSSYFRTLTKENSNVNIASVKTGDFTWLYAVWDNEPRNRVFFVGSSDGGQSWDTPEVIAGPEATENLEIPSDIQIVADNNEVLITWQSTDSGGNCDQYFIQSSSNGESWSEPQIILEDVTGCLDESQFYNVDGNFNLLEARIQQQIYLLAWNGEQWSEPQIQSELESFEDPESLNQIELGCHQLSIVDGNTLFFMGCDTSGGGDIWSSWRSLGSIEEWFPPPSVWSIPIVVLSSDDKVTNPVIVSDSRSEFHIFWVENGAEIHYANWDGARLQEPGLIVVGQEGVAIDPAVAEDARGRLNLVWRSGSSGEVFYSWANAEQANIRADWNEAQNIPSPNGLGISPDVTVDESGTIFVAYAIPLNEGRGIYITQSDDGGSSWSESVQVFDAMEADWEVVDKPRISRTREGQIHLIWTRYTLPGGEGPVSLYYARSEDYGKTWSEAEEVVEEAISWSEIAGVGDRFVYRIWQEDGDSNLGRLWYQYSQDNGVSWSQIDAIPAFRNSSGPASLTVDQAGRVHILQFVGEPDVTPVLSHVYFDGDRWVSDQFFELDITQYSETSQIASVISPKGELGVIVLSSLASESELEKDTLLMTSRTIELPDEVATPLPTLTDTPQPTPTMIITPGPSPTPTLVFFEDSPGAGQGSNPFGLSDSLIGPVIGVILAGVIVLGSFLIRIIRGRE